jgi:hypothetical protein
MPTVVRCWVPPVIPPTTQHFRLRTPVGNIHVSAMRWASCVLLAVGGSRSHVLPLRFKQDMIMRDFRPPQPCTWGLRSSGLLRSSLRLKQSDKELKTARCILLPFFHLGWGFERHSQVKVRRVCSSQSVGGCRKGVVQLQTSFTINRQSLT